MNLDWTCPEFDWTEVLDVDPHWRLIKIIFRLLKFIGKMVVYRRTTSLVMKMRRPNGDSFYSHLVIGGFVFCTFLPKAASKFLPTRCVGIQYDNGHIEICIKGLVAGARVVKFEESEFVSEEAAKNFYGLKEDS